MSTLLRNNCGCGVGDNVVIRKVDATVPILDAARVDLHPLVASPSSASSSNNVKELFLQQSLVGQYVSEGHITSISYHGRILKFRISRVERPLSSPTTPAKSQDQTSTLDSTPPAIVKVTLSTKISIIDSPTSSDSSVRNGSVPSEIDFKLIGGLKTQIEELRELVELPLKNPGLFRKFGVKPPRGVLLYGPPGTGKTLLAKVLAQVTGAKCFTLSAPEIMSKYYGESESKLRDLFLEAEAHSPALIFIDEIDAIAPKRDSSDSEVSKRIVGTLLTLMDGMDSQKPSTSTAALSAASASSSSNSASSPPRVVVLAATNRPNSLDPALRRPGRFDREIEIPIPNEMGRGDILQIYFKKMQHNLEEAQIAKIAGMTHGYVGADLSNLCKESALYAFKRVRQAALNNKVSSTTDSTSSSSDTTSKGTAAGDLSEEHICVKYEDVMHAMAEIKPSAMREIMVDIPKVKWEDIGGYEEVKEKLKQAVEWPLQHPEAFRRLNIQPTRGVLLYGPPGCSKTLLAKAVATQAGLNFIPIKGPELFSKYVGESERAVREVFRKARAASPAIIFFDEIDAIGGERGQGGDSTSVHDRVLAQMLNELDGIEPLKSVLFLAATNRPDIIDKALMRPGRIDQAIYISPPDAAARKKIFEICLRRIPYAADLNIETLVNSTGGFSGAEVTSVCREAGLAALQENIEATEVHQRHFASAIASIVPNITESMIKFYENFSQRKKGPA